MSLSFKYNDSGLRTHKTVTQNGVTTTYTYAWSQDGKLISQSDGTTTLYFAYDENSEIIGFSKLTSSTNEMYYYVKNLQGDVCAIVDSTGAVAVNYTYDAWGYLLETTGSQATTLGVLNPIRYRGYYYDTETSYYYLQSRYYDPLWGRFINADKFAHSGSSALGTNMFAYCVSDPVNYTDTNGQTRKKNNEFNIHGMLIFFVKYIVPIASAFNRISLLKTYTDFLAALAWQESSNNYKAVNGQYLGKYQTGNLALQEAGFKDTNGNWTAIANQFGVYSKDDYLNSPEAQEYAIRKYHKKICGYICNFGITQKCFTVFKWVLVTESGLLAASHLTGAKSIKDMFITGKVPKDGNNVPATDYMRKYAGYSLSELKEWDG